MSYSVRLGSHFPFPDDRVSARVITAFQQGARRAREAAAERAADIEIAWMGRG